MKQKNVIQFLIGGFPFLLALAVVLGLVFYYVGPSDFGMVSEQTGREAEMIRAVPLSEEGIASNLKIFSEVLVDREAGNAEGLRRAGKYLDSTLGIRNTGYGVKRPLSQTEEIAWSLLEFDLVGGRKPKEVVLVAGNFDVEESEEDSSGVAVLLSVARAMAGATPERTIRFVFGTRDEVVRRRYAEVLREERANVVEYIEIGPSVAGEITVGQAEAFAGVRPGKLRRISGDGSGAATARELLKVAEQIETTIRLAGRSQQ